jgi:hypothetical protein
MLLTTAVCIPFKVPWAIAAGIKDLLFIVSHE